MRRLTNAVGEFFKMPIGDVSAINEYEEVCTLVCHVRGQEYSMVFPKLVHARSFAWNMQEAVLRYFHELQDNYFSRPIKYIVDVGAHVGLWAIPFTSIFPECRALAIEPSKYNFPYLKHNIRDLPMIEALKMAVGDKKVDNLVIAAPTTTQRMELTRIVDTGHISAYGKSPIYRENVQCDTLDNIVKERVDWIKMDIEGFEVLALEGAREIIQRDRPVLQIEFNTYNQAMGDHSIGMLLDKMINFKYWPVGEARGDVIWVPVRAND